MQKSIPAQIHQLIIHISNHEGFADGFVRELTSVKRFKNTLCETRSNRSATSKHGFRVRGSGSRVQGSGFWVQVSGFRVQDSGFRFQD